jgi:hypothetical protein
MSVKKYIHVHVIKIPRNSLSECIWIKKLNLKEEKNIKDAERTKRQVFLQPWSEKEVKKDWYKR